VNLILAIPIEFRMAGLFVLGACLGALVNLGVYRLAWRPRRISPWSPPEPDAPARHASDRIPIVGWLGLRREAALHGAGFWVRPAVVELACALGLPWLYWWETQRLGLLPQWIPPGPTPAWIAVFHVQFAVHAAMGALMLVASLVDVDEKTIPDSVTVAGTLVALVAVTVCPLVLLADFGAPGMVAGPGFWQRATPDNWPLMTVAAPQPAPAWLAGRPEAGSLALGLACWWGWCFALLRRDWYWRHGLGRAVAILLARLRREPSTLRILAMGLLGSAGIAAVWAVAGRRWDGLLAGLVGLAVGGGLVWAVRLIGAAVLRREAMGFGDVTLMAMLGAMLGWQAAVLVFFLAPLAALAVGVIVFVLHRENEIPYGPFLCLAAAGLLCTWPTLWQWASLRFGLGPLVPAMLAGCLVLLPLLLMLTQAVKTLVRRVRG